ncbi:hypothetical protein ACTQ5J_02095 [Fundicoccus sp. Sow4_F4]|uniref:hypothetical protein n=1 Tax=Fundicoccus sp. Sow4_F4 TaxID=3438783 RepID=UPI003F90C56B
MSDKLPRELLAIITEQAIKSHEQQKVKEKTQQRDYRLRNATLLLKNYHKLKVHCKAISNDIKDYEDMVYDPDELNLYTLMKYKARTAQMLNYFDRIFRAYGELSKRQGEAAERRYRICQRMYIDEQNGTAGELSDYYNIDRSTVFRDINKAIEDLSIMLWGIDSFDDLK